jgi:hypothetical protein
MAPTAPMTRIKSPTFRGIARMPLHLTPRA